MVTTSEEDLIFVYSSPTSPPRVFRYELANRRVEQLGEAGGELEGMVTRRLACVSKDGTRVPVWLVHRADHDFEASAPTLQHPQLVAQKQDLDLLLPLRATPQNDQLKQPSQRPIHKREEHTPRTTRHRR